MRKMHTALLAGAVVLGVGAVAGLAAFVPSLPSHEPSHALTLQLPGGGTETIAYAGREAPTVIFHAAKTDGLWPARFNLAWTPSLVATFDPIFAGMNRQLDLLAGMDPLMAPFPDPARNLAALRRLPSGTSYSMITESFGNGVCTKVTRITKEPGDTNPEVVSQSSGNCGDGANQTSQPSQSATDISLRATTRPPATQTL